MRLEYGLVENALDSLRESMAYYTEGDETHNVNQYKFSILLAAHCAELLLKEILRRNHPALLFENIHSIIFWGNLRRYSIKRERAVT